MRQLLAPRPDAVRAGDAERDDRRAGAQREHRHAVRASWSAPSGLRVPSGKTNRTLPSSRIRWASRNASTSAAPRSTGWTPPLAAAQPTIGQSNSSFLPSQWIRRPSFGISHEPSTTASRFEAWLAARISGPSRGISSIAPSIRTRLIARPKTRPPSVSVAISGVIELSIGAGSSRHAPAPLGVGLGGPARLGVADRVDDGVDRVLEAVAVGRDDPRVGGGPERRDGARRVELVAPAERLEDGRRPPAPSGSSPRSSVRRRARSSTEASRKILRSASGSTTVPMSRPAMTIPPAAASARCRSSRARRSSGIAETAETAASTAGLRTSSVWSTPSTSDAGEPARGVGRQLDLVDQAAHARAGTTADTRAGEREPGHGAIEQARVAEAVADLERGGGADAALARRAGPVEGDDEARAVRGVHRGQDSL